MTNCITLLFIQDPLGVSHYGGDKMQTLYSGSLRLSGVWPLLSIQPHPLHSLPPSPCSGCPGFLRVHRHTKLLHASGPLSLLFLLPGKPSPRTLHGLRQVAESPFLATCSKVIFPFPLVILLLCFIFLQSTRSRLPLLHIFVRRS